MLIIFLAYKIYNLLIIKKNNVHELILIIETILYKLE